jgi:tight adherence protein B
VASGWVPGWFAHRLRSLAVTVDPVRAWRVSVVGVAAVVALAMAVGGPAFVVVVVLSGAGIVAIATDLGRDRADRVVEAGLPALLDRVAAGLRAGLGLPGALRESVPPAPGPLRDDLALLIARLDAGVSLAEGLDSWQARRPTPGTHLVTAALALCALAGGRSRPLDGVASTLRDRLAVEREVRAVSAQVRASAFVLVATPWAFVVFSAAQDPEVIGFFTSSVLGLGCLAGGVLLDLGGAWLMARTIRSVR